MEYVKVANYGQEREINATPEEMQIANWILNRFPDVRFRLVRKSNDYLTLKSGSWDIVRFKYTDRAKWLMFPTLEAKQVKHYIDGTEYVEDYVASIKDSLEIAKKFK